MKKYLVYRYSSSGDIRKIGENTKSKRICRFCNRGMSQGATFKKKAHAISEALGNKSIILNEECDECNEKFGNTIEPHLISHFDFLRTLYGVKNKSNKVPTLKTKQTWCYKQNERFTIVNLNINLSDVNHLKFNSLTKSIPQNIYKALVKYALSVIDSSYIPRFGNAIKWISDDTFESMLPQSYRIMNNCFDDIFELKVYIPCAPYKGAVSAIGVFRFLSVIYIYILFRFMM